MEEKKDVKLDVSNCWANDVSNCWANDPQHKVSLVFRENVTDISKALNILFNEPNISFLLTDSTIAQLKPFADVEKID